MEIKNSMTLTFAGKSENEPFARSCIQAFIIPLNPTLSELNDIKTAVSEAVTNCVVHAYDPDCGGNIVIDAYITEDNGVNTLHIKITDTGRGIENIKQAMEPFYTTKPDEERSGMGFTVMETFMDELKVLSCKGCGTEVFMKKRFTSTV